MNPTLNATFKYCLAATLVFQAPLVIASPCVKWDVAYEKQNDLIIGEIIINTADIFDLSIAKESKAIHRFANRIHSPTKPHVIRRQLLFKQGDIFQSRKLAESERLIRSNRFTKEVSITPVELCGKQVKIQVDTRDKWTLAPGFSFGKSGSKSKSGIEIQEHNLLGLGKSLALSHKRKTERNETALIYNDPQFLGSRKNLFASIQNNSDGKGHKLDMSLPFFELDSRTAWSINTSKFTQETSIYDKGNVSNKVNVNKSEHSAFWGWSNGLKKDSVTRFKVGWNYKQSEYDKKLSITESYPWFDYEHNQDKYTTRTNFKTMGEIEDVSLGTKYNVGIGLLRKEFGATDNHLKLSAGLNKGYEFEKSLGFINMDFNSYLGNGQLKGEALNLGAEWYSFNKRGSDLFLSGKFKFNNNLQPDEQILLGVDTGLRGYPKGFQTGDKSIIFTAEKRFHFDWYPLNLAKFGAVVFTDIGTAWGENKDPNMIADVGLGLRVFSTRSSITKALHLDLAFPLNGGSDIDDYQITIKTKKAF